MTALHLKSLMVVRNGQAHNFKNKNVKDGSKTPILFYPDIDRVFVEMSEGKRMVIVLNNCDFFQYEMDDGEAPAMALATTEPASAILN